MSSRWWRGKEATNGCRNNVVKGVTVPSVEKPNTWNSCITNPKEQETSKISFLLWLQFTVFHRAKFSFLCHIINLNFETNLHHHKLNLFLHNNSIVQIFLVFLDTANSQMNYDVSRCGFKEICDATLLTGRDF